MPSSDDSDDTLTTSSTSETSEETSEPRKLTTTAYSNPLVFYKLDGNPYHVSTCDPDVIQGDDGYWYMYATNCNVEDLNGTMRYVLGPIFKSANLFEWRYAGNVFEGNAGAATWGSQGAGVWAPSIIKVGNKYNYYYSLSAWGDSNPGIGLAVGDTPTGPWTHYGKFLDQQMTGVRNGIDPQALYVGEELFLIWGSFFGIGCIKLTDDGTEPFYGYANLKDHVTYIVENNRGEEGMDVDVNFEGSFVIQRNGKFYYMGSQGTCLSGTSSTYHVQVGVADTLFGPYYGGDGKTITDYEGTFGNLVIGPDENVAGTGHHTIIKDNTGQDWIIYHGFNIHGEINNERIAFMDKILWDENGFPYVENQKASINTLMPGPTIYKL
ncbi:MAG TPA: family 43 glycosylhydrolase [Candidatus Paceibacterota bacterium]|nr:family 43 glycosylhydrolase [Candidatus Paceibacterota bacterium]